MRVRIITIGSNGDVRPYVAFGVGLKARGHHVRIITHTGFKPLVEAHGLEFAPVAGDPRDAADNPHMRALHDDSKSIIKWWRTYKEVDGPLMRQRLKDCWEACEDAEVIVVSILPYLFGHAIAEKLQVPLVRGFYFPVSPTSSYPAEFVPNWMKLGKQANLLSYELQRHTLWQIARPFVKGACREILGTKRLPLLEPFGEQDRREQLLLYAFSPSVVPRPSDWGHWIDITGYWFLDRTAEWRPPKELVDFMDDGPPPLYIGGFGGVTNLDLSKMANTVSEALKLTGQRAVVLEGWGGLPHAELPKEMFSIDWVPFDWLFKRVVAVVHHGGAGTTAAGLRAGTPTIIVPFFLDQFYWGKRVFDLNVGPKSIPRNALEPEPLAAAIDEAINNSSMRLFATRLAERIQAEDGVARAVSVFEKHFQIKEVSYKNAVNG